MDRLGPRQFTIASVLWWTFLVACLLGYVRAGPLVHSYLAVAFCVAMAGLLVMSLYLAAVHLRGAPRATAILLTLVALFIVGWSGYKTRQAARNIQSAPPAAAIRARGS